MLSLSLLLSLGVLQLLLLNGNFLKLLIDDSQLALLDILELGIPDIDLLRIESNTVF